jgi:hypothetical protein
MMEKIRAAGVYDIPMSVYHSSCCDGPSVSASSLWTLLAECPAKYWDGSYLNKDATIEEPSAALNFGKAAHALALGEPEFAANFMVCPYDNLAKKPGYDWNIEWKAKVEAGEESRTLVRAKDFETVQSMSAALRRSPQVGGAFCDGRPEISLVWKDAETGVYLKSRPDWLPNDPAGAFLQDYKTARSIAPDKLSRDAFGYGYHLQAAIQVDAVKSVMGVAALGIAHICQEKEPPFLAELRMFTAEQIDYGRRRYRQALRLFAKCWELHLSGKSPRVAWPGYTETPQHFSTPIYIQREMENENDDYSSSGNEAATDDADRYLRAG